MLLSAFGAPGVNSLSDALGGVFPCPFCCISFPYPFVRVSFPYPFDDDLYCDDFPLYPFEDFPFDRPLLSFELLDVDLSLALLSLYACIDFPVWCSSSCRNEHFSPYGHSLLFFHDGHGGECQNLHAPFSLLHENVK